MRPPAWLRSDSRSQDLHADFSFVLGGPLYQFLRRAHLTDDALMIVRQRIVVIALFAWLPLFLLSALERHLLGGNAVVPFLWDVEVHVRFLVAMPLLIAAELVVHRRIRPVVRQFLERRLISESGMAQFDDAINSALRLRNSVIAEILMIVIVYGIGVLIFWRHYVALSAATWYLTPSVGGPILSLAGMWYGYVSLPLFQFLLIRWYFRLFIWARFLWHVARIELSLVPTHPDRLAGLGFLARTVNAFAPLAAAHGAVLAGYLANRIFYLGAELPEYKFEIAAIAGLVLCLVFGPLQVFAPQLARAKRKGNLEYGVFAEKYVREFDTKWLRGGAGPDEVLVGSADIQSLADLANGFEVVQTMRIALVTKDSLIRLVATTLAPVVPLGLTMMPLEELVKALAGIIL